MYENGQLKSGGTLGREFGLTLMESNMIVSAKPAVTKKCTSQATHQIPCIFVPRVPQAYRSFTECENILIDKCAQWEVELNLQIDFDMFRNSFMNIYKVTNVVKLRSFQYRLQM